MFSFVYGGPTAVYSDCSFGKISYRKPLARRAGRADVSQFFEPEYFFLATFGYVALGKPGICSELGLASRYLVPFVLQGNSRLQVLCIQADL